MYLRDRFADMGISLEVPDLNQGDFSHLTITRQLTQIETAFPSDETPVTLMGSSLGGLTSAHLAQLHPQVQQLVLLAPAFGFLSHWLPRVGEEQLQQWQSSGYLPIYHHQEQRSLPLHYKFVEDARQYQEAKLLRPVPTLILHGRHDDVIPIAASREYASTRPWVQLIELDSDHTLSNVLPEVLEATQSFCQLS